MQGEWDLTQIGQNYLGGVTVKGKKVREVGPASGRITLELERMGADVQTLELGGDYTGDFLVERTQPEWNSQDFFRRLNDSFEFVKASWSLKAELTHGTIYAPLPSSVDITLMGNMLLHRRDPFKAVYNAAQSTSETLIITETIWNRPLYYYTSALATLIKLPWKLTGHSHCPVQSMFMPTPGVPSNQCVWNYLSPDLITRMLELCGFKRIRFIKHYQTYRGKPSLNYTIVAERVSEGYKMLT
jgi:hypothetical protein